MFFNFLLLFFENSRTARPGVTEAAVESAKLFGEYDINANFQKTKNPLPKPFNRVDISIHDDKFEFFPRKHQKFMQYEIEFSRRDHKNHHPIWHTAANISYNTLHHLCAPQKAEFPFFDDETKIHNFTTETSEKQHKTQIKRKSSESCQSENYCSERRKKNHHSYYHSGHVYIILYPVVRSL